MTDSLILGALHHLHMGALAFATGKEETRYNEDYRTVLDALEPLLRPEITTYADLHALPFGTVIIDGRGYVFQQGRSDWWVMRPKRSDASPVFPVQVLYPTQKKIEETRRG